MKLKSYFSGTVEAAMELARKELGEDALLVHARPATPETRYLGSYEVVFGVGAPQPAAPAEGTNLPTAAAQPADRLSRDVAELKQQIERLATLVSAPVAKQPALAAPPDARAMCRVDATLGRPGANRAVVALVGPPGSGKTTTLAKLAAQYGLACRRPPQIITADVYRIAAADQLRALAAILGIGCEVVETPVALAQALEECRTKEMVLIDTPGLSFREMDDGADLARLLRSDPEVDTHMVLPASMKPSDMSRFLDRYAVFEPKKIIFTRIDETAEYAGLIQEAAARDLPVSFLATGQQIPDDLEEATDHRLAALLGETPAVPATLGRLSLGAAA